MQEAGKERSEDADEAGDEDGDAIEERRASGAHASTAPEGLDADDLFVIDTAGVQPESDEDDGEVPASIYQCGT